MKNLLRLFLLLGLVTAAAIAAQAPVRTGEVIATANNAVPIRIQSSTEALQSAALQAFGTHGQYKLVASNFAYDVRFTAVSATEVRADVSRGSGGGVAASQSFTGNNLRTAFYRAADYVVVQTNGVGLRSGYFSARLALVGEQGGKKEIYSSDLFFSNGEVKKLTGDGAAVLKPRWSPDGSKIIFTSWYKSGSADIFQYDVNPPYTRTTFASYKGTNMGARYSPNGQRVAMVLSGGGTTEIYVADASGRNPRQLTARSDSAKSSPAWSPDSSQIIFESEPGPQLRIMSASGGAPRTVNTASRYAAEADWNMADPNKIACTVRVEGGRYQIAVCDLARGTAKVVSSAGFDAIEPCWLADGRHLVYTARDRTTSVLCILDTETGKSSVISRGFGGLAYQANVWTPRQ